MYFELWIERARKDEIIDKLRKICDEVWEIYYNYDLIVRVSDESKLKIEGVLSYKRHYKC
ncbi:MAG: hypothetical protein QXN34_01605 [Archaeoglobaceae archaeon]